MKITRLYHPSIKRWALVRFHSKLPDGKVNPVPGYTAVELKTKRRGSKPPSKNNPRPSDNLDLLEELWTREDTIADAKVVCLIHAIDDHDNRGIRIAQKELALWAKVHEAQVTEVSE